MKDASKKGNEIFSNAFANPTATITNKMKKAKAFGKNQETTTKPILD